MGFLKKAAITLGPEPSDRSSENTSKTTLLQHRRGVPVEILEQQIDSSMQRVTVKTRGGESGPAHIPDLLRKLASPEVMIMRLNFFTTESALGDKNDPLASKQVLSGKVVVESSPRTEGMSRGDSFAPDEFRPWEGRAPGADRDPCRAKHKAGGLRGPAPLAPFAHPNHGWL